MFVPHQRQAGPDTAGLTPEVLADASTRADLYGDLRPVDGPPSARPATDDPYRLPDGGTDWAAIMDDIRAENAAQPLWSSPKYRAAVARQRAAERRELADAVRDYPPRRAVPTVAVYARWIVPESNPGTTIPYREWPARWSLIFAEPCPFCDGRHVHSGGSGSRPVLGVTDAHCGAGGGTGWDVGKHRDFRRARGVDVARYHLVAVEDETYARDLARARGRDQAA